MTETRNLLQEYKTGAIEMGEIADIVTEMEPSDAINTVKMLIQKARPDDNEICCRTLIVVLEDAKSKNLVNYKFSVREIAALYINRVLYEFKERGRDISELVQAFNPTGEGIVTANKTRPEPTGRFAIIAKNMMGQ
jgi:hypothetical protein